MSRDFTSLVKKYLIDPYHGASPGLAGPPRGPAEDMAE
jgi:hypothetical protein